MALPGGPLEICFSFDTTQSMTDYIEQVKGRLQSMVQRLQADIPGIRIALCAHGDYLYEDAEDISPYDMIKLDFTNNVVELCDFIKKAEPTFGEDWCEFYEYVLKEANASLSWSQHTNKVFVLIGDASPHDMDDEDNLKNIDWTKEVVAMVKRGITVYGIYCKTDCSGVKDKKFFESLSKRGGGSFLKIEQFGDIFDTLMAICYREQGETALQLYETEVKSRQAGPSKDVNKVFTTLKKSASNASSTSGGVIDLSKTNKGKSRVSKPAATKTSQKKTAPTVKKPAKTSPKKTARTVKKPAKTSRKTKPILKKPARPRIAATPSSQTAGDQIKHIRPNKCAMCKQKGRALEQSKLRREMVPETNFILRGLPWSSWTPAFCRSSPDRNQHWKERKVGIGCRATSLFKRDGKRMALYELAVRSKVGGRKIVVYRFTSPTQNLLSALDHRFKNQPLRSRLDNILKKNCVVYVRRLILGRGHVYTRASINLDRYSYLWDSDSKREFLKDDISI